MLTILHYLAFLFAIGSLACMWQFFSMLQSSCQLF
uniref:Uncharacterized protein n=1 Tax=Rhizophora mucronata TaxID=61149 RepID=A0A2P2N4P8_RHIMU